MFLTRTGVNSDVFSKLNKGVTARIDIALRRKTQQEPCRRNIEAYVETV